MKEEAKFWEDFPIENIGLEPKEAGNIQVIVPP
jgi:hypothetical protein